MAETLIELIALYWLVRKWLRLGRPPGSRRLDVYYSLCDIEMAVGHWILLRTATLRMRLSDRVIVHSNHLHTSQSAWDDLYVHDRWNLWLPLNFTINSRKAWEYDNEVNREVGEPENEWKDVSFCDCNENKESCGYPSYYFKDDYLTLDNYADAIRKHLRHKGGARGDGKGIELRVSVYNQKSLDDDNKRYIDWVAKGSPPFKIEMTPLVEDKLKEIAAEDPSGAKAINKVIGRLGQNPFC